VIALYKRRGASLSSFTQKNAMTIAKNGFILPPSGGMVGFDFNSKLDWCGLFAPGGQGQQTKLFVHTTTEYPRNRSGGRFFETPGWRMRDIATSPTGSQNSVYFIDDASGQVKYMKDISGAQTVYDPSASQIRTGFVELCTVKGRRNNGFLLALGADGNIWRADISDIQRPEIIRWILFPIVLGLSIKRFIFLDEKSFIYSSDQTTFYRSTLSRPMGDSVFASSVEASSKQRMTFQFTGRCQKIRFAANKMLALIENDIKLITLR
jgi:hypothetical protein